MRQALTGPRGTALAQGHVPVPVRTVTETIVAPHVLAGGLRPATGASAERLQGLPVAGTIPANTRGRASAAQVVRQPPLMTAAALRAGTACIPARAIRAGRHTVLCYARWARGGRRLPLHLRQHLAELMAELYASIVLHVRAELSVAELVIRSVPHPPRKVGALLDVIRREARIVPG
jgi:hypothetical protein